MVLPELLREIEDRGVELVPAGDRLRFRPKRNLTPELVEGLRMHKAAILERLEGSEKPTLNSAPVSEPTIRDAAEVFDIAHVSLGTIEDPEDAPYPPPIPGHDPLVHRHTAKALFFRDVRRRDRERRKRDGLPPWIRVVDGGAA